MKTKLAKSRQGKKWPSKKQWTQFLKVLNQKEKIYFLGFLGLFVVSALFLTSNFYLKNTEMQPARGGHHIEGVVGSPRFINPIYAPSSDVDRDLVEIIFSGLTEIAQDIEVKEDGEVYQVQLKENVFWHDGQKLTADDVVFTIKTMQNPDYKSPLRGSYLGIEIEKLNDYSLRFKLKNSYSGFLERLNFKIIPRHIWQDISPQNFLLTNYNLQPIGSGPYQFKELKQNSSNSITSLELVRFKKYFAPDQPFLSEISFRFFKTEEDLIKAARQGNIDGFAISNPNSFDLFEKSRFQEYSLSLPRYFAVFFNADKSRVLADENIRQALNYATDKQAIIDQVLLGRAQAVDSPILPNLYGYQEPSMTYPFDPEKAEALLTEAGFEKIEGQWVKVNKETAVEFKSELKVGSRGAEVTALQTCLARDAEIYPEGKVTGYFGSQTETAVIKFQEKYSEDILKPWGFTKGTGLVSKTTRAKLNEICFQSNKETELKLFLTTVQDPVLEAVASQLKSQWQNLGIQVEIATYAISELEKDFIKPRNYEMLLFGEVLEAVPDPFPFWHSSQVKDPGLNLAKYENSQIDKLLEAGRVSLNETARAEKYQAFQDILIEDAPCLFLYSPDYVYFVSKDIKGLTKEIIVNPSKRFANIADWYIRQKRAW